jgi:CDP-diglyceride synthetase
MVMASSIIKRNPKIHHTVIETAPKATLLMLLTGLFILFLGALIVRNSASPTLFSAPIAYIALYTGNVLGGFFCSSKLEGTRAATCALASSALLCLLIILAKAFVEPAEEQNGFLISLLTHLLVPLSSVAGALLGERTKINKELKKRKKHYRSKK